MIAITCTAYRALGNPVFALPFLNSLIGQRTLQTLCFSFPPSSFLVCICVASQFITVEDVAGVRIWHLTPKVLSTVRLLTGTMKEHYVER